MNQTIDFHKATKLRILDAAEKLFAEKKLDAISVRDITREANANVAAVSYHFGSREGLFFAVMNRYLTPVNEERLRKLAELESRESGASVEEILTAFVKPLLDQIRESELSEKIYCQLVSKLFGDRDFLLPFEIEAQVRNVADRFSSALRRGLPDADPEELSWRLHFIVGGFIHLMTRHAFLKRFSVQDGNEPLMESAVRRFISFASAGLRNRAA